MLRACVVLLAVAAFATAFNPDLDDHWTTFKAKFNRRFTLQEERFRRSIFEQNIKKIQSHNLMFDMGVHTHHLGVNQFSDRTPMEYQAMNGARPTNSTRGMNGKQHLSKIAVPDSVDWRTQGYVTPVKDQGQCGSCWAFSSTGAMEGAHFKTYSQLPSLSEQNLVDCVTGNYGCNGGWMDTAFQYVLSNGGIDSEAAYPYTAVDGSCKYSANSIGTKLVAYTDIPHDEDALLNAVATVGPISVAIDANHNSFMMYTGGIFNEPACQQDAPDHAVLVVGYGTENGVDYWIVKNSWNTSWGESGYIRMIRGVNICGIANYATYPSV